jgi:hypothetical protein
VQRLVVLGQVVVCFLDLAQGGDPDAQLDTNAPEPIPSRRLASPLVSGIPCQEIGANEVVVLVLLIGTHGS